MKYRIPSKYIKISIPIPPIQATFVLLISILMMLGSFFNSDTNFPWLISGAMTLLFVLYNNVLSIFAENQVKYIQISLYTFIIFTVLEACAAWFFSSTHIFENEGVNRTIFVILIMAHFSLMGMCFLIRSVADFLQQRDEQMHKNGRL
jgi:hypothetical protein